MRMNLRNRFLVPVVSVAGRAARRAAPAELQRIAEG